MIKPTVYNVNCIAADFTRVPHRYTAAHVFFLPPVPSAVTHKLKNGSAGKYIRRIEDAFLDFRPLESQVFTFGDSRSLEKLYNNECINLVKPAISRIALQMVSVCATLGEYPIVRFYNPDKPTYEAHTLSYMIAQEFQSQIDVYAGSHKNFPDNSEKRPRSIFLVMDRTVDLSAPFLHDFNYQALAYDLLDFKDWKKIKYKVDSSEDQKQEVIEGKVTEKDTEWVSSRHSHIADVSTNLQQTLSKLLKDNPHFANKSTNVTVGDLKDMIFSLPMFKENRDRYTMHLDIASRCMDKVRQKSLQDVSIIEQTLATGFTEDGTKPKTITDDFIAMLANPELDQTDRTRLVLLYAMFRRGLVQSDFAKLQQHCGLTNEDLAIVHNLMKLGAPTLKDSPKTKLSKSDVPHRFHSMSSDGYVTSRYVCGIHNIVDSLLNGKLSPELFPYTKEQPMDEVEAAAAAVGINSLRSTRQRPTWVVSSTAQSAKQRIFVFVAGGVTASETKTAYDLSKTYNREIIIGGNDFTAPRQFLTSILSLSKPRASLGLEEDRFQSDAAPEFLFESDRETAKAHTAAASSKPLAAAQPPSQTIKASPEMELPKQEKEKKKGNKFKSLFKSS